VGCRVASISLLTPLPARSVPVVQTMPGDEVVSTTPAPVSNPDAAVPAGIE
jgi:hypothetical protein